MSHMSHISHLHCTAPLPHLHCTTSALHCTAHTPALHHFSTCTAHTPALYHFSTCTALFIILNKSKFKCYYTIGLKTKPEEISSFITMLYSGVHKLFLTIKRRGAKMIYSYHEFRHMSRFYHSQYQQMQIPIKIFYCLSQLILWPLINKSKTNTAANTKNYKQK